MCATVEISVAREYEVDIYYLHYYKIAPKGEKMKGARPLTDEEIRLVIESFSGKYAVRNRCLFILGVNIGARVSKLTALKVGDVWQHRSVVAVSSFDFSFRGVVSISAVILQRAKGKGLRALGRWGNGALGQ